jgi:hypothetical protein
VSKPLFPGFPAYLEAAAAEVGHPEAARPARRISTLAAMANLCAQAALADEVHAAGILAKASEFRDQLLVAHRAAELMLADFLAVTDPGREPSDPS